MSDQTPAQEEFASFLAKNSSTKYTSHPEDRDDYHGDSKAFHSDDALDSEDEDEEDRFRNAQIEAAMRMPTMDSRTEIRLPPAGFDAGAATGVKGVIADARAYENAKRSAKWKNRVKSARRSVFGDASPSQQGGKSGRKYSDGAGSSGLDSDFGSDAGLDSMDEDEKEFLDKWRESRRRELEKSSMNPASRQRRTSPSSRQFGRLDNVDAMGYLDAIEKVGPETAVVVFVYDHEVGHPFPFSFLGSETDKASIMLTILTLSVPRLSSHRDRSPTNRPLPPRHPLRQGSLRRDGVRQRSRPVHPRVPQPGRPVCESYRADRDDSRR